MKIKHILLGALLFISMGMGTAQATIDPFADPLRLDYIVTSIGDNRYNYNFTLTLTNEDNSWSSGQGWGQIRFGNTPHFQQFPLTDFVGDTSSLSGTPFTHFSTPVTFYGPGLEGPHWIPTAIGQSISWSGTSTAALGGRELSWSTLATTGGAKSIPIYTVANPIPEPGTFVLAGMGLVTLLGLRRREQRA